MKKFGKAVAFFALIGVLSFCSILTKEKENNFSLAQQKNKNNFKIGIAQLADHPALDSVRRGFVDGLKDEGINAEIDYSNAQGEVATTNQIVQKFVSDKDDLIFSIATPTAQSAQQATRESKTPVIFSAVTDAVKAKLVESNEKPNSNITGVLDEAPIKKQLKTFKEINPSIKRIGIVYNTSEENSLIQIKQAKKVARDLNLQIVEIGISSLNDISQTLNSYVKKIDGIYTITDNMVASSISVISTIANENNLVTIGAEEAHVMGGVLFSNGLSYYEIGKQAAKMAKKILIEQVDPSDIPVEKASKTIKKFNRKTLEKLGLNKNTKVFKDAKDNFEK